MLTLTNLSYSLGGKLILDNISAQFNDGEIIGITGAAGSGKSTFIDLLKNKRKNYQGDILFDSYNLKTEKKIIAKLISSYSPSDCDYNPEAAVKDWILSGRINLKKRLSPYKNSDKETAYKEMTNFGLNEFSDIMLKQLPETYRKMASLARAFSARSKLLLLENPETGLHINQRVLLSKCIKKYAMSGNNTVLFTSGDLDFIAATCDRIIVLHEKKIAESGTHRIITGELIKKYFNVDAIITKNIYTGLPEVQVIEEG